ncbi:MAG: spore coat protein U domain-containing protein [Dolichospermum sp. LBC05a]|nr:spore coat protein U domain-containing protein [Dolichospermum sp. OL01]MCO5795747.1 spore coat protein U domain-containing protein [Dolichospermum sp. OL03]MCS6281220.1 spore coat protein U domain-containing protein [Dolichospermum sp.]QSV57420.1 MAG: spore coat protein U domain-containing protein [Dolichospermum sp. LBC05a]
MMRRFALASALFVAVGSAAPSMAVADSNTTNLDILAFVQNNCTISTAALDFGDYNPVEGSNVTGTVTTNCTAYVNAVITLDQGFYPAAGSYSEAPLRRLQNVTSSDSLNYTLYQNSGKTTIWGNSTATGVTVTGSGTEQSTSVYGEIPAGQSVPAGFYTDYVAATVTY